jgi:hypothetical protein
MKTKNKIQKPIEIDVSLKYICPNDNCGFDHWIFLREAKTKNFKIVCECGTTFKPKRIKRIEVVYATTESVKKTMDSPVNSDTIGTVPECVVRAIKMMISLGYGEKDAQKHVMIAYNAEKITDAGTLVKKAISNIGGLNV